MITVICPKCNKSVHIDESIRHGLCTNVNCSAWVNFQLFTEYDTANIFYKKKQPWFSISEPKLISDGKWVIYYYEEAIHGYNMPILTDLVSEDVLKSIQAGYADYIGGPFTLFEIINGKEIHRIEPLLRKFSNDDSGKIHPAKFRNFTKFCRKIRTQLTNGKQLGDEKCHETDIEVVNDILGNLGNRAKSHICWCGFVEFTAPIIINGNILGVIFTGQMRHKNKEKQINMEKDVILASEYLKMSKNELLSLAFDDDVQEIDDIDIPIIEDELDNIASRIQSFANYGYQSQREIRERQFLDRIENIFTEAIDMVNADINSIRPILSVVMKSIREFSLFPFSGIFLSEETNSKKLRYEAGNLWNDVGRDVEIELDTSYFQIDVLQESGVIDNSNPDWSLLLCNQLENVFCGYRALNATNMYLIHFFSSNRHGVILLAISEDNIQNFFDSHYFDGILGRKFLNSLGRTISQHMTIYLDIAKIKQNQEMHRYLMISLAHEINTPIQSMLADAANILDELQDESEVKELAEHNLEEVDRLHLLSENIIGVLSERARSRTKFSTHSVYRPLNEACEIFKGEADAKGCDIIGPKSIGSQFPKISMSLFDLTLAFKNLIHNAVKYSFYPPKGFEGERFIKVEGKWTDNKIRDEYIVIITNYGVGIQQSEIESGKIFEPFYRSEWATDRYRTGSGLGLALVKRVVEDVHNGKIEVQSKPMPGSAYLTVFKIFLPVSG